MNNYRHEEDGLGKIAIPETAYWGAQTQRALENFRLSGERMSPALARALAQVKKACALANKELNYLPAPKADAIIAACDEIIAGRLADQFPIDALSGGAGTSANMNINEVLANRAIELLGGRRGDYALAHPLEDVNLHQSTNDVYPTAVKVACITRLRELADSAARLQGALQAKEAEFAGIMKIGRTELMEAVPVTLGAEFSAFAQAASRDRWRVFKSEERLRVVNLGGTAAGTGIGAPRNYIFLAAEKLRDVTGLGLSRAENLAGETANADPFVEVSGILKAHASNIAKMANDLRLLNLLGEIKLPAAQMGSTIMPGKVNPVICEAAIQAALRAMADDALVCEAASRGTLQIIEFLPLLAHAILDELNLLANADNMLAAHVGGIAADPARCAHYLERAHTVVTAFLPHIGYRKAQALLEEFKSSGRENLREFLKEKLGGALVDKVLSPQNIAALGYDETDS